MRHVVTGVAYLSGLVITATAMSLITLYLVGPHGGLLPNSFYIPVLCIAWAAVIVLPVLFARWIWRRAKIAS